MNMIWLASQCRNVRCIFNDFLHSFSYLVLLSCFLSLSLSPSLPLSLSLSLPQAFPHSMLQPLAKRVALEKSAGPGGLLNPSVLHYQQALANTPLHHSATLFPTGKTECTHTHAHTLVSFVLGTALSLRLGATGQFCKSSYFSLA